MSRSKLIVVAMVIAHLCASAGAMGDIWVDAVNGDDSNSGATSLLAKKRITAAMAIALSGDTIKVLSGDYDVGNNEVFPIVVKPNVDILGQQSSPGSYPRIGGDVNNTNTRALFEVLTDGGDRLSITFWRLKFAGENAASKDAPSCIYIDQNSGYRAEVIIDNCAIERSEMNASNADGRANIVAIAGDAPGAFSSPSNGLALTVVGCTIVPSDRGGVELRIGSDASGSNGAVPRIAVTDSTFMLTNNETAKFAIDVLVDAFSGSTGLHVDFDALTIRGNTIDSCPASILIRAARGLS